MLERLDGGLLVVAIMLMGLVSVLSTGVFERTRGIGILLGWLVCHGQLALVLAVRGISRPRPGR